MRQEARVKQIKRLGVWCLLLWAAVAMAEPGRPEIGRLSTAAYDVVFQGEDGQGAILIRKADGSWYEPIPFVLTLSYPGSSGGAWLSHRFVQSRQPPKVEAGTALFRSLYEHGLEADFLFNLEGPVLRMAFSVRGEDSILKAGTMQITLRMPALGGTSSTGEQPGTFRSARFPDVTSWDGLKEKIAGWVLENKPVKGRSEKFPYAESVQAFTWDSRSLAVSGVYAPHRLLLEGPTKSGAHMAMYLYQGMTPANGYTVCLQREAAARPLPASERGLSMTFSVVPEMRH